MNVCILGGTRFFGIYLVKELLKNNYQVTIATRGQTRDEFGQNVNRILIERTDYASLEAVFRNKHFDVIIDNLAYSSNDVKNLLDVVECNRYVMTSTMSVYDTLHYNIQETDFNPFKYTLKWCERGDFPYYEVKRQAEAALFQKYSKQNSVAVRFPYVIGIDDYTKRLHFYVEHIVKEKPMFVDNINEDLSFIQAAEAGKFLAFLAKSDYCGIINGANEGIICLKDVINYVENKTKFKAIINKNGDRAPYNATPSYSLDITTAKSCGFEFSNIHNWIYELLDDILKLYV